MSTDYHPDRIETLIALSLSKRWPRDSPDVFAFEGIGDEAGKEGDGVTSQDERTGATVTIPS